MHNLMSSAEIMIWDFIVPVEKKAFKKQMLKSEQIEIPKKTSKRSTKELKQAAKFDLKPTEKLTPQSNAVPEVKPKIKRTKTKRNGLNTQLFMIFSSSTLGFIIGVMISLFM